MDFVILEHALTFMYQGRYELLLFLVAGIAYMMFFRGTEKESNSLQKQPSAPASNLPGNFNDVVKMFHKAFQEDDIRTALRCWNALKRFDEPPVDIPLASVVESLQRFKKDATFIVKEIRAVLKRHPTMRHLGTINEMLDTLSRRLDSETMDRILEMCPTLNIYPDLRTYEIFLNMYFTMRNFTEVKNLEKQMKEKDIAPSAKVTGILLKTALKENDLNLARGYFRELRVANNTTPSHLVGLLVELACKLHSLQDVLPDLEDVEISQEVFLAMLQNVSKHKDEQGAHQILSLWGDESLPFFEQVMMTPNIEWTCELVQSVLALAGKVSDATFVDRMLEVVDPTPFGTNIFAALAKLYNDLGEYDKACDVYEKHLFGGKHIDSRMERALMNAALRCGRSELAKRMIDADTAVDMPKHIASIRTLALAGNLQGALQVFHSLEESGAELNSVIYNAVLDACVECKDLPRAKEWMDRTKEKSMVDVVSYNTLIKAHLAQHNFVEARALMDEMRTQGLQPNRVTYNELVNAMANNSDATGQKQLWDLVKEMQDAKVRPNHVTCSILLKCLNAASKEDEISRTMELIQQLEEPMDEVLLSSVVEACVRIGKPDLLTAKLAQLQHMPDAVTVSGAHTFGSLIKAYGHAKDIDGVWRCWKEMRSRHIKPTPITLGCMVEAIVMNGDAEGAYELIQQMREDDECVQCLNAVIYCSVLKGFTREKRIDRVWTVYKEMKQYGIELSIVTFNTLIDACARTSSMRQVKQLLEDMKERQIRPNVITYSTMLKGHCQEGNVHMGFAILQQMKKETKLRPDEIMFNSLLDGCAQQNLVDKALSLVDEMEEANVKPSNFTVSILVKLMNRARRLDDAFELCDSITTKYNFPPNVHVYTNLIQACIHHRQLPRALGVLDQMIDNKVYPDGRTYTVIIRGCLNHGRPTDAEQAIRTALALPGGNPSSHHSVVKDSQLDTAVVDETLLRLLEAEYSEKAQDLLRDIKECCPYFRIDARTDRQVLQGYSSGAGYHEETHGRRYNKSRDKGGDKGWKEKEKGWNYGKGDQSWHEKDAGKGKSYDKSKGGKEKGKRR
eukprot:GEMP01004655.1.p1 GENE.GEMP01004655.1~~GEMP01004655.1.p1  ORF type:complete len:1075 (+),score=252.38 GEMP01004655.1:158-3382(+)